MRLKVFILIICLSSLYFSMAFAQEFRYDSHGKRDPFIPPKVSVLEKMSVSKEVRLEGVVFDPRGGSVVIVNGQMIREGDSIDGLVLLKIEENKALFDREGEVFEVLLNKDSELIEEYLSTTQEPTVRGDRA